MCCSLKEVVLLAGSFAAGLTAQDSSVAEDQQASGDVYTHWAYPRMKSDDSGALTREIVLHRIAPLDRATEELSRRVVTSSRALTGNGIHSISRGQMLVSGFRGKASFVDLGSGQVNRTVDGPVEFLLVNPTHDSVIFSMPIFTVISQYDFASKTTRPLVKGSMQRSRSFATHTDSRIALSPDGHQLATATFAGSEVSAALIHVFDIHIVDLQATPPAARRLKHQFSGGNVGTGGGYHIYAPAMYWIDRDRLLIAAPPKREGEDAIVIAHDKWLMKLFEVNVKTDEVRTVCKLPFPGFSSMAQFDPGFWRRNDDALMMRSKQLGDYRIEVRGGKSVSDRRLSTQYEFRGDIYKPQLWAGDDKLAARVNVWDVSVSPDGRQIVWMVPVHQQQYGWTHAEKSFFFHSEKTGTVKIGQGRFDLAKSRPTHPVQHPPVLWLTDEDLLASQ